MLENSIPDNNDRETSGPRRPHRENAYVKTFDDTVTFALHCNANLWTEDEKQLLLQCRPDVLCEGARVVLSRLSLRRMKWIKSTSISHYVLQTQTHTQQDAPADGLIESLEVLKAKHFIECLQASTTFETAFEAVESCFLLDDLTRLFKRITTSKGSSTNNKVLNKEGILEAIFNAVRTQRTLFGQSLTHKFASSVLEVLKELQPAVPWKPRSSFPMNSYTSRPASSYGATNNHSKDAVANKLVILRIQPQVLHLLRRCQRIYQISCNAGGNGYSGNTSSSPTNNFMTNPGAAAANNTSAASTGFASVLQPLEFNAPLLVIFNKVQYPPYVEHCARSADKICAGRGVVAQNSRIFESQLAFKRWEGAVELHAACLDKTIEEVVLLNEHSTPRLRALLDTFHSPHFLHRYLGPWTVAHGTSEGICDSSNYLFILSQICDTGPVLPAKVDTVAAYISTSISCTSDAIEDTDVGVVQEAVVTAKPAAQSKRKTVANVSVDLTALNRAHIVAVLSLLSYHHSQHGNNDGHTRIPSRRAEKEQDVAFADYMIKFDAGTQLAYACSDGAAQLEKEPFRQYSFAILLQELLISLPYLPHRRGLWYKRLCINYAHLQLHRCALRACLRCLADPLVNVSDKTELQTRAASLNAKILKQSAAKSPGKRQAAAASADVDAVKLEEEGLASAAPHSEYAVFALEQDFPAVRVLSKTAPQESDTSACTVVAGKCSDVASGHRETSTSTLPAPRASRGKRSIKTASTASPATVSTTVPSVAENRPPATLLENNDILTALWLVNTLPSGDDAPVSVVDVLCTSILQHILLTADASKLETPASPAVTSRPAPCMPPKTHVDTVGVSSLTKSVTIGGTSSAVAKITLETSTSKRKLSQSAPNPMSKVSKTIDEVAVAWSCTFCTFLNSASRAVVCEICLQKRTVSSTSSVQTLSTASIKKTSIATVLARSPPPSLFKATDSGAKAASKCTQKAAPLARAVSCNDVVDLVSDSDCDGGEDAIDTDEPVFIASTSSAKTSIGYQASPYAAASSSIDTNKNATVAVQGISSRSTATEAVEVAQLFLTSTKEHLEALWVSMQRHLLTLTAQRRRTHGGGAQHSVENASVTGGDTVDMSHALVGALNLHSRSETDEEQDDLILLGLLPPSVVKCENKTRSGRVSLENLIPAPPFFVVNGKRTGDPANRKGKSKFCGVNDELVNVETFVMQKCFAVDPDDCLLEEGDVAVLVEDNGADGAEGSESSEVAAVNFTASRVTEVETVVVGADWEMAMVSDSNIEAGASEAANMCVADIDGCAATSGSADVRRSPRLRVPRVANAYNIKIEEILDEVEEGQVSAVSADTPGTNMKQPAGKQKRVCKQNESIPERGAAPSARAPAVVKSKKGVGVSYTVAVEGGGWQGWHCEGAVFQSLFGLLMWDVLFTCPCCPTADAGCSGGAAAAGCSVFITPFQDAPLDLGHRSFFRSRRARILARIAQITAFSTQEMIAELGSVYRNQYGESCRGVHWGITLRLLQLMAVCMGSAAVAAVCRALAVNYKHFTGGAPDLMLVRVHRRVLCTPSYHCTCPEADTGDSLCDPCSPHNTSGAPVAADVALEVEGYQPVDVSCLLGVDWATQMQSEVVLSRRRSTESSSEVDILGASTMTGRQSPAKQAGQDETQEMEVEEWAAEDNIDELEDLRDDVQIKSFNDSDQQRETGVPAANRNEHIRDLFLPSLAPATVDAAWEPGAAVLCTNCRQPCAAECKYTYDYKLQAKYVEVKGPTDSLMFRQRVWLHILNQASRATGGDSGSFDAYVCNVKE